MSSPDASRVIPEVVLPGGPGPTVDDTASGDADPNLVEQVDEQVLRPTKLIRIASMVRTMLDEVRRAPLDDAGRRALREIHERSLRELHGILSPELQEELSTVVLPFSAETPTESELRIAQAQLVGWLEGLFHGIQATLFTQQAMAQQQFEEVRRRHALEIGAPDGAAPTERAPGQYL
jgi:hypothetical protein